MDIKPSNIFLTNSSVTGPRLQIVLRNFGMSHSLEQNESLDAISSRFSSESILKCVKEATQVTPLIKENNDIFGVAKAFEVILESVSPLDSEWFSELIEDLKQKANNFPQKSIKLNAFLNTLKKSIDDHPSSESNSHLRSL